MGQEYFINSEKLQQKVRNLLPAQGGAGPGVDLSSTTQIVPIIDLTETAEGSDVRQDLQTAFSFANVTEFNVSSATNTVVISSPGYYRLYYSFNGNGTGTGNINVFDGVTQKRLITFSSGGTNSASISEITVFIDVGISCRITANNTCSITGSVRQIADIDGNLIDP